MRLARATLPPTDWLLHNHTISASTMKHERVKHAYIFKKGTFNQLFDATELERGSSICVQRQEVVSQSSFRLISLVYLSTHRHAIVLVHRHSSD